MICAVCETQTQASPCAACGNDPLLVGRYRLKRVLGRGAQGTTFLADGPHGVCAIKELQLGRSAGGKATELFHREAAVLSQLNHAQIPSLFDHFVDGVGVARSLYLVQQFVPGQNLEERLNTHRFTQAQVADILRQVAEILTYLHGLSPPVIHRDIKPSNILIDDDGAVHLIDFGSVRDVMRDTVGGGSTVAGTFGYMAPEQLVGDATPQSDLYAVGMTGLRLLTREMPTALVDRQGRLAAQGLRTLDNTLSDALSQCVEREASDRLPTARSLLDVLSGKRQPDRPTLPATIRTRRADAVPAHQAIQVSHDGYTLWSALLGRADVTHILYIRGHLSPDDAGDIAVIGRNCRAFDTNVHWLSEGATTGAEPSHPDHYSWKWFADPPWRRVHAEAVPVGQNTRLRLVAGSRRLLATVWVATLAMCGLLGFATAKTLVLASSASLSGLGIFTALGLLIAAAIVRGVWAEQVTQQMKNHKRLLQSIANEFVAVHPDPDDTPDERLPMESVRTHSSSSADRPVAETS